jgi:hypothetical protein
MWKEALISLGVLFGVVVLVLGLLMWVGLKHPMVK